MKKYSILFVLFASVLFFSCKKEGYKAPVSSTVNMAGRWWIELKYDDNQDGVFNEDDGDEIIYSYEYIAGDEHEYGLITSNTAANTNDSLWIIDRNDTWPFKIKAPINYADLTFKPSTLPNASLEDETVRIISGKILKGAAHTKSGAVADSIFIEFEFSDDEGSYYMYTGHRDSGHPEDRY